MWVQKKDKEHRGETITWHVTYLLMYEEAAFKIPSSFLPSCLCERPGLLVSATQSNMKWCEVSKAWRQAERSQMWKKLFDPVHANRHGGRLEFIPGIRENEKTRLSFLFCFVLFFFSDQRRHFSPSHRSWSSFRIGKVISKGSMKGFFVFVFCFLFFLLDSLWIE